MNTTKSLDDIVFSLFKNIIYEQNKALLRSVAKACKLNEEELLHEYLRPEYYLPIIIKEEPKDPRKESMKTSSIPEQLPKPKAREPQCIPEQLPKTLKRGKKIKQPTLP